MPVQFTAPSTARTLARQGGETLFTADAFTASDVTAFSVVGRVLALWTAPAYAPAVNALAVNRAPSLAVNAESCDV